MESFIDFFADMPTWQRAVWLVLVLMFSWGLESFFPLFELKYRKWKHAKVNFVFMGTTMLINGIFGLLTVVVFSWSEPNQIGLLYYVDLPLWVELLITILIFDLVAQYAAHYMLHKVKWMWKLHMTHHSDLKVDATTGLRLHPGDFFVREVLALVVIIFTGAPLAYYFLYRTLTIFFTFVTHANWNPPLWLDKGLSYLLITPNMHKFHHHYERPWTDTNFGNIFSIWDRMFGTFVYDDTAKIRYGLDVLDDSTDEDLAYQFKLPFDKTIKTDY